jgi:hypothetical protein
MTARTWTFQRFRGPSVSCTRPQGDSAIEGSATESADPAPVRHRATCCIARRRERRAAVSEEMALAMLVSVD